MFLGPYDRTLKFLNLAFRMSSEITRDKVVAALSGVMEPDFGKDIVSLDLIAGIDISEGLIKVEVKSSNPALHARKRMQDAVEFALE